jgi:hypothetical protein
VGERAASASTTGTARDIAVASRNAFTGSRTRLRSRSWESTPANETVGPDEVNRKAANAPATTRALSIQPGGDPARPARWAAWRQVPSQNRRRRMRPTGAYRMGVLYQSQVRSGIADRSVSLPDLVTKPAQ